MKTPVNLLTILYAALLPAMNPANAAERKCEEKKIDKNKVPAAVMQAFEKAYPKTKIKGIEKEDADGKSAYEFRIRGNKAEEEVLIADDGTLLETKEEISVNSLPDAVVKGITAAYPRVTIKEAERITKGGAIEYEVDIRNDKGSYELTVDSTGTILSTKKEKNGLDNERGEKDKK